MRLIASVAVMSAVVASGLDRMAEVSVKWDHARARVQAAATASGTEAYVNDNHVPVGTRMHVLPGEEEFPTGGHQKRLRVERTRALLEGRPIAGDDFPSR
jgi:hypothetical protein